MFRVWDFSIICSFDKYVFLCSPLSKHLLEMCNLADIERKLNLYTMMFYHNRRGDRDGNYIKADSLKIELIAGGLNWKQQQHILCPQGIIVIKPCIILAESMEHDRHDISSKLSHSSSEENDS